MLIIRVKYVKFNIARVCNRHNRWEIWKKDEVNNLKRVGYEVIVVWENDYKKNKEQVLADLKENIDNIIKENKNG